MQSVPIPTKVVSLNPTRKVYWTQLYVIKFVSDLTLVAGQWVYLGTPVSTTNNTDRHDVAEIFLKVALNTITSLWQKLSGKLAQKVF